MTISDNMYDKLANVTAQLGRERSQCDKLGRDNEALKDKHAALLQKYSDLVRDFEQYKERYHVR